MIIIKQFALYLFLFKQLLINRARTQRIDTQRNDCSTQ